MSTRDTRSPSPVIIPTSLHGDDFPQRPGGLKRSASVASLPTPPRTHHKRHARPKSRASNVSQHLSSEESGSDALANDDSDLDGNLGLGLGARLRAAASVGEEKDETNNGRKKRRMNDVLPGGDEEEDDENAFWTGRSGPRLGAPPAASTFDDPFAAPAPTEPKEDVDPTHIDKVQHDGSASPEPAMLTYRVKAPVSPPPSRRRGVRTTRSTRGTATVSLAPGLSPMKEDTEGEHLEAAAAAVATLEAVRGRAGPLPPSTPPRSLMIAAPTLPVTPQRTASPSKKHKRTRTVKKARGTKIMPVRDSPYNPFLLSDEEKGAVARIVDPFSSGGEDVEEEERAGPSKSRRDQLAARRQVQKRAESSGWESSDDECLVRKRRARAARAAEEDDVVGELTESESPTILTASARKTRAAAKKYQEPEIMKYTFRGQKAYFANPHFKRPEAILAAAALPLEHPEFEADEACAPKMLFPEAHAALASARRRKSKSPARAEAPSTPKRGARTLADEFEDAEANLPRTPVRRSPRLAQHQHHYDVVEAAAALEKARAREREKRETAAKARLAASQGLRAGAVVSEKDAIGRRAAGPSRRV
ncbi:hypothetical protein CONPUDRAFT_146357 [Coniophora puteana RWD-64-598 SS2]|uniref:Uncharacterized protein n=1 Tax=Coniophora puteana (strain RWD-64-598) TaxID=741705 RepID=A0A5M3MEC0_CONPW|nr:uncharacterized protein CONPUDRAFT_146357 [Coniophora puteana RWD-64-598 SS2]EIW77397.1 hypothetical protein CONPUDRAFT_146357 [Coniophora puteana RWD-64-598 SS2]